MHRKKTRVVVIHDFLAQWRRNDLAILQNEFVVRTLEWKGGGTWPRLLAALARADILFLWFVTGYGARAAQMARLMGVKTALVAGGVDVAAVPEANYGAMRFQRGRKRGRPMLEGVDLVIPFSEFSASEVRRWASPKKMEVVYVGGIDVDRYRPAREKEDLVISGGWITRSNLKRKGHEDFVKAAALLPHIKFALVGKDRDGTIDYLRTIAPPNLDFVGDEQRLEYFQKARVYVQLSAHEGFGLSVAEAMACGCIPVVTGRGSLPEVVGETGVFAEYADPASAAAAISRALCFPASAGEKARNRVIANFDLKAREKGLVRVLRELVQDKKEETIEDDRDRS